MKLQETSGTAPGSAVLERNEGDKGRGKEDEGLTSGTKRRRTAGPNPNIEPSTSSANGVILSQGAEAILTLVDFFGRAAVRKERLQKHYRHPDLDKRLRSRRLNQEVRVLSRLHKVGVPVPAIYDVDLRRCTFLMQAVAGTTLKAYLHSRELGNVDSEAENVMRASGILVARMHASDVVHGDLTTGNVMVNVKDGACDVSLIDFGLSFGNGTEEDLAVDLYVFERAVIAAHSENAQRLNDTFLSAYMKQLGKPEVISRLEDVRGRGRKRDMTG